MMKRLLTVVLAALLAGTASAQRVQLGVRAGIFSQDMELRLSDLDSDVATDARLGWQAAIVSRIRLIGIGRGAIGMGLYLQPEIVYSQNSYRIQKTGEQSFSRVSMRAFDMPVLLSYQLSVIRVQAGPVFNLMFRTPSQRGAMELMSTKPAVGYGLGASVDVFGGLVLDARYNGQFAKLRNNLDTGDGILQSVRGSLSSWSIGLSWLF